MGAFGKLILKLIIIISLLGIGYGLVSNSISSLFSSGDKITLEEKKKKSEQWR